MLLFTAHQITMHPLPLTLLTCYHKSASRQSTTATTTTDDSAQSSVNSQLIANRSVNTGHDSLQELYQPIDNQLSHSSYESSHRIPTIISDRRCRNQLSSTCSFRPKYRDNCLVRIPLEDSDYHLYYSPTFVTCKIN